MILPDFALTDRANQCWQYSGLDSPDQCLNQQHFADYPFPIEYKYNSRGFRDQEWPDSFNELKNAIWCVGDSFTVGVGSPIEHTWPRILKNQTGRQVINISMDGASNNWIARKIVTIQKEINPTNIVVMWSYVHRREHNDSNLTDEKRRIYATGSSEFEDLINLKNCVDTVKNNRILQLAIPEYSTTLNFQNTWNKIRGPDWPLLAPTTVDELVSLPKFVQLELKENFKLWTKLPQLIKLQPIRSVLDDNVIEIDRLDLARDGHHFDRLTAQRVVDLITSYLMPAKH